MILEENAKEAVFTREQLAVNDNFKDYADIIYALIPKGEGCSEKALNRKITRFLSRKIN